MENIYRFGVDIHYRFGKLSPVVINQRERRRHAMKNHSNSEKIGHQSGGFQTAPLADVVGGGVGQKPMWFQRIAAARERGMFNSEDSRLSFRWTTCACGEQDARIPREEDGAPIDRTLNRLGSEFAGLTIYGSTMFDEAVQCLLQIEQRASELLAKVQS